MNSAYGETTSWNVPGDFMKSTKLFGICILSAMAVVMVGCGKKDGANNQQAPAPGQPWQQNQNWQQQQTAQPFQCQPNTIQLRSASGSAQCFPPTVDLRQACAQMGGTIDYQNLCRRERRLPGEKTVRLINWGGQSSQMISLWVGLYPGESLKVFGNVDALTSSARTWSAELRQNASVLGSASSNGMQPASGYNLEITAYGSGMQNYGQPYAQPNTQPYAQQPVQPYNPQYNQPQVYPNPLNYQVGYGFTGMNQGSGAMAIQQQFSLDILFRGRVKVRLYSAAISCEDGRGNSYPCL